MFTRYSEQARRAIFFARFEASQFGTSCIETEHLLLGLAREDKLLAARLSGPKGGLESLRKQVESRVPPRESVNTTVDMPLSRDCLRVLKAAGKEADRLEDPYIGSGHLILALLRVEAGLAQDLLGQHGIDYATYHEMLCGSPMPHTSLRAAPPLTLHTVDIYGADEALAPSLQRDIIALERLIDGVARHLNTADASYGNHCLKRRPWSRKQALGHLVDLASAHHQWIARALVDTRVAAIEYPPDSWVSSQQYSLYPWPDLVDLWVGLNRLMVHVLMRIPEAKMSMPCRIGIEQPVPLSLIVHRYVEKCEDLTGQIVALL